MCVGVPSEKTLFHTKIKFILLKNPMKIKYISLKNLTHVVTVNILQNYETYEMIHNSSYLLYRLRYDLASLRLKGTNS
jgi:hypothetical protein